MYTAIALTVLLLASAAAAWALRPPRRADAALPVGPATPQSDHLAWELWRQGQTPRTGSLQDSLLIPIFAFDLMPPPMRRLYDQSRALDTALLEILRQDPSPQIRRRVLALQQITRGVRRKLVTGLTMDPAEQPSGWLEPLEHHLQLVEQHLP